MEKKIAAVIYLKQGQAVRGLDDPQPYGDGNAQTLAEYYSNQGADALLIFDLSQKETEHEEALGIIKEISRSVDIPMYGLGNIKRVEDVKKLIYAGGRKAVLNFSKISNRAMLEEVSHRFGKDKISLCLDMRSSHGQEKGKKNDGGILRRGWQQALGEYTEELVVLTDREVLLNLETEETAVETGARTVIKPEEGGQRPDGREMPGEEETDRKEIQDPEVLVLAVLMGQAPLSLKERSVLLKQAAISGLAEEAYREPQADLMGLKRQLKVAGAEVNTYESAMSWQEFQPDHNGLLPVVVQDYKTEEVLMVAYMNQEAFESTVATGRMTYWSRSRQELWVKGLTSGHFQYVKELRIDCDKDTLLAKVAQVGSACHTGNKSCFYRTLLKKDYVERNPMKVFEEVYGVIEDRKAHPKEGSYTNYLFDKGIDKILKKVGEEATEIVIAAKNPNPEEIKYEISDFLYHVMVLMAEKGVTWEEIARELADR